MLFTEDGLFLYRHFFEVFATRGRLKTDNFVNRQICVLLGEEAEVSFLNRQFCEFFCLFVFFAEEAG